MFLAWLVLSAGLCAGQQAPRDAVSPPKPVPGAILRGRVTAGVSGRPLHRVKVTVNGPLPNPLFSVTDTRGFFEIPDVPAGSYTLTATRAGYLPIQYGQRRPREAGRTFHVESGQTVGGIDMALFRGAVLAGRVADEQGDPLPGATVEAIELRFIGGRRVMVPARITTTNDQGDYRLSGLNPGAYQVRASTTETWESEDGTTTFVHAVTYFPGVLAAEQPQSINAAVGQEVAGLEFRIIAGRAARITGIMEDSSGNPMPDQVVNLDRIIRTTGGALMAAGFGGSTRTDRRGAFELPKLAAGEYMVYTSGADDRVAVQVILNHDDHREVILRPRKPTVVSGTIVTDEGTVPTFSASRVNVSPVIVGAENPLPVWAAPRAQPPRADWSFRLSNMDGQYLFRMTDLPGDWMIGAVTLGARDVTDTPLAVTAGGADVPGLRIVLSRKGGRITGEVVDPAGAPAPDATVIVFADASTLWGAGSRFVKATRPDNAGHFSIGGLPPGAYRIAVRDYVVEGQWEDPEFLEQARKDAVRVDLGDGASEAVRLTLEPIR